MMLIGRLRTWGHFVTFTKYGLVDMSALWRIFQYQIHTYVKGNKHRGVRNRITRICQTTHGNNYAKILWRNLGFKYSDIRFTTLYIYFLQIIGKYQFRQSKNMGFKKNFKTDATYRLLHYLTRLIVADVNVVISAFKF